jgi:hypothetical protein
MSAIVGISSTARKKIKSECERNAPAVLLTLYQLKMNSRMFKTESRAGQRGI